MDFFEVINSRASYRKAFDPSSVPREHLERIVEAGIRAPSGYNAQSTSFVIVTSAETRSKIASLAGGSPALSTAQAIIVVVMDPAIAEGREFMFGIEDYAAATENILLAIAALGYASVWIDGALRRNGVAGKIARLLNVPPDREVRVILPLGVPAEPPVPGAKKPFGERAWFERYKD